MSKKLAVIAVHGMGNTKSNFADALKNELVKNLGLKSWENIYFNTVYYQSILQKNQNFVMKEMKKKEIDYISLRSFLLYGFSDAAGLERNASHNNSPYEKAQKVIYDTIEQCRKVLGDDKKPVVIIAHSLGCQVISNYIWDSQAQSPKQGIWKNKQPDNTPEDKFRRLKTIKAFFTTGCNIPIFVAGFPQNKINAISTKGKGYNFNWHNYYDRDDALGWPLKPLSPSYKNAVYRDHEINANGGIMGFFTRSWNPLSHGGYWTDSDFINPLSNQIRKLL